MINEIHYNPDVKTERVEFIELYNAGTTPVNLEGWSFSDGLRYVFPSATLSPDGYVVVAQDPAALAAKYDGVSALGPFNADRSSELSKYGERLTLRNAAGQVVDEVDYQLGFPWPTVGDAPGYSIELIHPALDNDLGGSWRASVAGGTPPQSHVLIASGSTWRYFKGRTEASTPTTAWRQAGFDDGAWLSGQGPVGYGQSGFVNTELSDMDNNYISVFFRKTFVVTNPAVVGTLLLEVSYDDGVKVWINGVNVANGNLPTTEVAYNATANSALEVLTYVPFPLNTPASFLVPGTNILAIQAHNASLGDSSDFWMDTRLTAEIGPSTRGPTPGRINSVHAANAPPQIRQVDHNPQQPRSGDTVRITAKVTDPDGVGSVTLQYQLVDPGAYIELTDPAYTATWVTVPMNDAGQAGDEAAGDDVYTATLPAALQTHRRLVRYRITAADALGASVRVPYADDPQPNFAYFAYDGVPAWSGAIQPGAAPPRGTVFTVGSNVMNRLPVYHLISRKDAVEYCTGWRLAGTTGSSVSNRYTGDIYHWQGTLVYDGHVYDHIHYRARGGVWRYSMVKNMWKFDLNRGHDFEARDNWGRQFAAAWTKLNLGANIQQGDSKHRGEQGMFESVGFRLFQMAGVPASHTAFVQFRIIDEAAETDPATQYEGDFWGLYLATEQMNGRFLEERGLPDSNFYKMEGGTGELNNLGPYGPTDKSDLNYVLNHYTGASDAWWQTCWDLPDYYSYQAIVQAIHHYDINANKNFFYYTNTATRKWEVHPWDLDLSWAHNMYNSTWGGNNALATRILNVAVAAGTGSQAGTSNIKLTGTRPAFDLEFRNRIRELRDLLFNTDQAWALIDEYASVVLEPGNAPGIIDADRCQWDYNPKMISSTYTPNLNKAGQGLYYQFPNEAVELNAQMPAAARYSFLATVQHMHNYVSNRSEHLDELATDSLIPSPPAVTYTGPANYPITRLTFRSSNFSGPGQFAALKWRLGEVTDTNSPACDPAEPRQYEVDTVWDTTNTVFVPDVSIPPGALRVGRTYRVRAQMVDTTGRTSHWSPPVQFRCGESEYTADLLNNLRITEIMYHPPPGGCEYIELRNISPTVTLDLAGVRFTEGIDFTFPPGAILPPGAYVVVAQTADLAAFRAYYGINPSVLVVGPFAGGSLNNGGEQLTVSTSAGGTDIVSFDYRDSRGWPVAADGAGHSLVLVDGAEDLQRSTTGDSGTGEYGGNWRPSSRLRGSPGQADTPLAASILLNEIATHTDYNDPLHPEYDSNDWIELYNTTDADVTLDPGWYLSDDAALLTKWAIPAGTVIPGRGWVSVDEVTGFHAPITNGFGLDKAGEALFLSHLTGTAEDRVVDAVGFKGQENDWSFGRFPDGGAWWHALHPRTRDAANAVPTARVIITEILYHPPPVGGTNDNNLDEFVEIHNPTAAPVPLFNTNGVWRLDGLGGDGNFLFPSNLILPPGGFMLVVNFPTNDTAQLAAFRAQYGLTDPGLVLLGEYSGRLPNNSGRVALEMPQAPDVVGEPVSWVIVDEVVYADLPPWPCDTDGTGHSLQRVDAAAHGSDPFNWTGQAPSPAAPRPYEPPGLPDILVQPADRVAATNGAVQFSVGVCGTPPFAYQWNFNGQPLPGQTNATLFLTGLHLEDAGLYSVRVANAAGAIESRQATLIVQLPPVILTDPQPFTVVRDQDAMFTVEAGGTEPLCYQWLRDGVSLTGPGATNRTLVLTGVQTSQAGEYSVNVYNTAGSVISGRALLTVLIPATITNPPQGGTVYAGSNYTFSVGATGTGTLLYQWRHYGTNIPHATNATLVLTNVQLPDAGPYTVWIADAIGPTLSDPVDLFVKARPAITEPLVLTPSTVPEGRSFTASISATGTWPMGFRFRSPKNSYFAVLVLHSNTAVLAVDNVSSNLHHGLWDVGITNVAGSVLSAKTQLTVVPSAPFFVMEPTNRLAEAGVAVEFVGEARGTQPIVYQWYRDGTNALADATNAVLALAGAQATDQGDYTLVAANSVGMSTSAVATLTILAAPHILEQPAHRAATAGDNVALAVSAVGAAPLGYQWLFNGNNLPGATNATLWLLAIQTADAGEYRVLVTNQFGFELSAAATVTVTNADFDTDGLPFAWETAYGLSDNDPTDAALDLDRDGMSNWAEYTAGTNPTNALSFLGIRRIWVGPDTAEVHLSFLASSNRSYSVLSRDTLDPGAWIVVGTVPSAPEERSVELTHHGPGASQPRFYRLVTPQQDESP
ncbi:MAG: lamin tail domain-containing protein [Verrucomicrobia bacterium]|nr:lamin tail domain-containing protein [Verrucomicrobiota bacterium]